MELKLFLLNELSLFSVCFKVFNVCIESLSRKISAYIGSVTDETVFY